MSAGASTGGLTARLARWSVGRPGLVFAAVALVAALGAAAATRVPVDAVPDITNVQVVVLTRAAGLGPVEVENLVTHAVEIGVAGVPGVREVRSTSRAGLSSVTVVFEDEVDPLAARLQIAERVPSIAADLPSEAEAPELGPFTTGLGEVLHFTARWPGHDLVDLHTLVDWEIAHPLRHVAGVVEVNTWGGRVRQFQVTLDPQRMAARGVTLTAVREALLRSNRAVGAGTVERHGHGLVVRGQGMLANAADIGAVLVRADPRAPVLVRDVADVAVGPGLPIGVATADGGGEVVYGMVQMVAGGNARTVVAAVRERLDALTRELPPGARVDVFYDRADFVRRVLDTVARNLAEGAALVAAVLLIALGDLAAGLAVGALIPLSALAAALVVERLGLSGNLMSLGAVDFGLLVDGAVVVVEHAMSLARARRGDDAVAVARDAVGEVARPMAYGVSIIALVYVPILTLEGVEGRMFRPMAVVVLSALGAALALSLTLVPALAPALVRRAQRASGPAEPLAVRLAARVYAPALALATRWPRALAAALAAWVIAAGAVAWRRGGEFIPRLDEGSMAVQVTRPPSTSLEEGARGSTAIERALRSIPEVTRVVSRVGSPAVATDLMGPEQSDVFVNLTPPARWRAPYDRDALADAVSEAVRRAVPGAEVSVTQPIEMRMAELLAGVRSDVGVKVYGEDLDTLRALGERVAEALRATRGGVDVRVEQVGGLPSLDVRPDRDALARHGLRSDDVLDYVQAFRAGVPAGRVYEGERRFDLVLRARGVEAPRDLPVPVEGRGSVALRDLAAVDEVFGPAQVSHEDARRRLVVEANVRGRDLASYVSEVSARLARTPRPRGYTLAVGGQYQNLARASRRLALIVPAVLLAILVALRASLGRWRSAALVFVNVPVAASGGVMALAARGMPLSITAGVGFIALAGVAVLNGLVLVTEVQRRMASGVDGVTAAVEGARSRLRAVLTTATVAALGFAPMALARGTGADVQRPLATVIIGGLVTATAATLLLLPALVAEGARRRVRSP